IGIVLSARLPIRRRFGAEIAYRLWLLVPLLIVAVLVPGRTISVPADDSLPSRSVTAPPLAVSPQLLVAPVPMPEQFTDEEGPSVSSAASMPSQNNPTGLTGRSVLRRPFFWVCLWLFGALGSLGILRWQQRRYEEALGPLSSAEAAGADIWFSSRNGISPALVGMRNPRIILPANFFSKYSPLEQEFIVAHERVHLRRGDAQINGFAAALACVFWFNPLLPYAVRRLRIDQELACDAAVMDQYPTQRRSYGEVMLKEQLSGTNGGAHLSPLPLGCHWRPDHPMKERLMQLKAALPTAQQRLLGTTMLVVIGTGVSTLAWASQPTKLVPEDVPTPPDAAGVPPVEAPPTPVADIPDVPPIAEPIAPFGKADALSTSFKTYQVDEVKIEKAMAVITVIPERRDDYQVQVSGNYQPTIQKSRNELVIKGGLGKNSQPCKHDSAEAILASAKGMRITLRTPLSADLSASGVIHATIGEVKNADISIHGCGTTSIAGASDALDASFHGSSKVTLGDVRGALDLSMHGSSKAAIGNISGPLDASLHGSSRLTGGTIHGITDLSIHGSSKTSLAQVKSSLDLSIHGSVEVSIGEVTGFTDASMHGNTQLFVGKQMGDLDANLHGSSTVKVDLISSEQAEISASGASDVELANGRITDLALSLSGGSRAEFKGYAKTAQVENRTPRSVYIERVDELIVKDSGRRGKVVTKNNPSIRYD
ncbi:MAG: M56 family metallopeptidase, partial [Pseudomonadota bacterium]